MSVTTEAQTALASAAPRALAPLPRHDFGANLPPFPPHPLLDTAAPRTRAPLIFGLAIFLVFVVGFAVWAGWAPLAEASVAPGVIKVEGSRRTIQHLEGGIVREILARDGAKVKAGDVIMRLDPAQSDSVLETQRAQRWALLAQDARLAAEIGRATQITFPEDLRASADPRPMEAITGQRALFEARQANLNSQVQVLQARIDQQLGFISGAKGQLNATRQQMIFAKQEEQMRRGLVSQGLGRLPELLALQRATASLEGTIDDLNGQIARANASIDEARKQIQTTLDQRLAEAATDRREVRGKLSDVEEKRRSAVAVSSRRDIVAPGEGTLVNQKVFTVGAVLKPGDPIFKLIPTRD